jgi:hypothetical protein
MFRDAARIGQIVSAAGASPLHRVVLEQALSRFDQAAAIRLSIASLAQRAGSPLYQFSVEARRALSARDTQRIREVARGLRNAASTEDALISATSGALVLAGVAMDASGHASEPITENGT